MTGTQTDYASEEIASSLRLRPERPPVNRLSRKVLARAVSV